MQRAARMDCLTCGEAAPTMGTGVRPPAPCLFPWNARRMLHTLTGLLCSMAESIQRAGAAKALKSLTRC